MEAIILAGGVGSRLRTVVKDVPKPMALVAGRPFLSYVLDYLHANGITKVVLSVGYKWQIIHAYFQDNYKNISIAYSVEENLLGTGGAIMQSLIYCNQQQVFVVNGDTLFLVNLHNLLEFHNKKASDVTLALKPRFDASRYGLVLNDGKGRVTVFQEKKTHAVGSINGGVYCLNKEALHKFCLPQSFMWENFLSQNMHQLKIFGFEKDEYFIDIGIPEDYARAQVELKR